MNLDRLTAKVNGHWIFDIRTGERSAVLLRFGVLLLVVVAGHTVLETARDTLLLSGPGPRALGLVYMGIAGCTLPAAALAAHAGTRLGPRRALAGTLGVASSIAVVLFLVPTSRASILAIYIMSGVIASVAVPMFWTFVGTALTLAQGRRLFGFIAAAGVVGGVLGSGLAALALPLLSPKGLLLVSAALFGTAGTVLAWSRGSHAPARPRARERPGAVEKLQTFRDNPFLARVALIVFLSTATLLTVDYLFKSTVARSLPSPQIGPFVARYYLALNIAALFVQLFVASPLVRTLGVAIAIAVTPLLICVGAASALLSAGALASILVLKAIDGSLRHSVNRITDELIYLPVPTQVRQRAKPLIDGALGRGAQTVTGAALLVLGGSRGLSPRPLAAIVCVLAFLWLLTAASMRGPYLDMLRRAIPHDGFGGGAHRDPIDLESAQILVQRLASEDPVEVLGAMHLLSLRRRDGLVPALVLLHPDEEVLVAAVDMFGASARSDWIPLARRLLSHPSEGVRMAVARALMKHEKLDPAQLAQDVGPRVHAYATLHMLLRETNENVLGHTSVAAVVRGTSQLAEQGRLGLLAAIADAAPTERLTPILLELSAFPDGSVEATELFARAATRQGDPRSIPRLVSLLSTRAGREAVRAALVSLGDRAFAALEGALLDTTLPRLLRMHVPKTMARFGSRRAAESLLRAVETEIDGLIRYKSIRALGVLVEECKLSLGRDRVERQCNADLVTHFRVLSLRVGLGSGRPEAPHSAAERLLLGMLGDKLRQSLDRAFRLLKIAYANEEIHRVYLSCLSGDGYARANAGEFLDALLRRRPEQPIRTLLRLVSDDLPDSERAGRAAAAGLIAGVPSRELALIALVSHPDPMVTALAALVALEAGSDSLRAAVEEAQRRRSVPSPKATRLLWTHPPTEGEADDIRG